MEQVFSPELLEFRTLLTAIKEKSAILAEMLDAHEVEEEENKVMGEYAAVIETQVFSTLINLSIYQLRGWRELIDE